ncbi:uncharacterized protein LOC144626868 [Crassostrea virginica]
MDYGVLIYIRIDVEFILSFLLTLVSTCSSLTGDKVCLEYKNKSGILVVVEQCCYGFHEKNNMCIECNPGFRGENCNEACPENHYGKMCANLCKCNDTQICHHVCGCIRKSIGMDNITATEVISSYSVETCFTSTDTSTDSTDVQTTNGILGADGISNLVSSQKYNVIRLAFTLTVPGMFVLCIGVNFLCYKIGFKKGKNDNQKSKFKDNQSVHNHYYDNENDPLRGAGEGPGPSRGQIITDPAAHNYAAYGEIKEQRQRMLGSQRGKDGGYITPMSQDRPMPAVEGDGNGYISPTAAAKDSSKSKDSPLPPGNGGYLSPLEE